MIFDKLVGQKNVRKILAEAVNSGKIGHAYLFLGEDGIGRMSFAMAFAEMITCRSPEAGPNVCGECMACVLNRNETNPDIKVIELTDRKSISIEQVREIQDDIYTAPLYSRKKVYIIKNAETMTAQAQNALLKTLEEPPEYVTLILICNNLASMLETIISRVVKIDFARYTNREIGMALVKKGYAPKINDPSYVYSDGIIGRAFDYFESEDAENVQNKLTEIIEGLIKGNSLDRVRATKYFTEEKERKRFLYFTMISLLRDIAVISRLSSDVRLQNENLRNKLEMISKETDYYKAMRCVEIMKDAWERENHNANYAINCSFLMIRLQEELNGRYSRS